MRIILILKELSSDSGKRIHSKVKIKKEKEKPRRILTRSSQEFAIFCELRIFP